MRYTQLFGKTIKAAPKDAAIISHKLLYQAGFIRESTAGRYYFLPLGIRVQQKIQKIIKQEMDAIGGQELITPFLHPKELWKETNRTNSVGFELMSIKDRSEMEFVLGGTAEEMLVDLIRKFQISYKDLPLNLYQFSTKFRDELRARGGLLRLREFIMKDAYSFHASETDFKKQYKIMMQTYTTIFTKLGLTTTIVASDNGYIGGEYCDEFVVESEVGESKFLTTSDGSYAAHEDVAVFKKENKNVEEGLKELTEVEAIRGTTMEDGVALHRLPLWQQIKDVLFVDEKGRFILAIIRGDYEVNETKLMHLAHAYQVRHATEEEIRNRLHSEPGFIAPVGIKEIKNGDVELLLIGDPSLRTIKNAYGGANKKNKDLLYMNIDRDYTLDIEGDIALAKEGYETEDGKKLILKKGIEVGNIFQLGFHYSAKMKGATFMDSNGQQTPYYMGCYGIGIARTMAAIVEKFHDAKGIMWPQSLAPYAVQLIVLSNNQDEKIKHKADNIYAQLQSLGIEVLYDEREVGPGEKFADADLIGLPIRLVVSAKSGENIEWKERNKENHELISMEELLKRISI